MQYINGIHSSLPGIGAARGIDGLGMHAERRL
jgi:hypothetical protein